MQAAEQFPGPHPTAGRPSLNEKFFGCIAGCHIGSAMGATVEGWSWERIEREYGLLYRLLPYSHYSNKDWVRAPGPTEDGVERQKLMITAIIEKGDRIKAEDLRRAWVDHMNANAAGLVSEPFEGAWLAMARTHLPVVDIGKYCDFSGLVSLARSCHPIGLINAGDLQGAIEDVREVGQLYNTADSRGMLWAEVPVITIAAATRPGGTVDCVLSAVFDHCDQVDSRFIKPADIRAARFYRETLGLSQTLNNEQWQWAEFDCSNVSLCLHGGVTPPATIAGGRIALAVEDVHAAWTELKRKGAPAVGEPVDYSVCCAVEVCDPDGNTVILHKQADGTLG